MYSNLSARARYLHGLRRLAMAVCNPKPPQEKPQAVARRLSWCLAFGHGDTCESVLARHPDLAPNAKVLANRVRGLRRYLPFHKGSHVRHWRVVQDYLALHHPEFAATIH